MRHTDGGGGRGLGGRSNRRVREVVERLGEGRDGENVSNSPYCSRWMATRLAQELHGETRSIGDLEEFPIPNLHTIRSDSI